MIRRLALLAALVPAVALAQTATTYVVQPGDTLYRISRAHDLTVDRLRSLNEIDGTYIAVGQTLRLTDRVPLPSPPPPRSIDVAAETVRPDAPAPPRVEGPSVEGPAAPAPPPSPAASGGAVHVVAPGETLFRIALRYDTSVDDLRRLNAIDGDRIEVGQRLVVGGGGTAPAATGVPVRLGPPREWSITDTTVPADLVHFVEPGETLYSIASTFGLEVDALVRLNALSTAPLEPGTPLRLPVAVNPALAIRAERPPPDEEGLALVYPDVMRGRSTESGEPYDPAAFTLSHRDLPFGTVVLVTNPTTGRSTFARVTDRGPVSRTYLVELSEAAAAALALDPNAARRVEVRRLP